MSKVNIANYVVYDLANRFNCIEYNNADKEIVGMVAEKWHKQHFVSGQNKSVHFQHNNKSRQNFLI